MAIPQRGLKDIRTLSGSGDGIAQPHKVHLKISCLEMEKIRRGTERKAARKRTVDIDRRLEEIEVEKKALLQLLPQEAESVGAPLAGGQTEKRPSRPRGKRGSAFRY